jgi:predicted HTH transcriptional regulator
MKSFFEKDTYDFFDIQSLIDNQIEESIHLDFKAGAALSKQPSKKKELSKDIASFANSDGGIIIYGLSEQNHVASSFSFVEGNEFNKEWLEQLINTTINRRIDGIEIFPIREDNDFARTVYIVKIPKSFDAPHQSKDKRFYKRFNFESVMMEEYEIRQLYGRKIKSQLIIDEWSISQVKSDDKDHLDFLFSVLIYNTGDISEKNYKVNVIFEDFDDQITLSWSRSKSHIDYTMLESDRVKISAEANTSIFPNEAVNALRFKITIPKNSFEKLSNQVQLKIYLFYNHGEDIMEANLAGLIGKVKFDY